MDTPIGDPWDLWTNTFSGDAAFMFIDPEMERHVNASEQIFADEVYRLRLSASFLKCGIIPPERVRRRWAR